jgi:hypothetical protein
VWPWVTPARPIVVIDGGKSPAWMQNAMLALAKALPNAEQRR